LHEPGGKSDSVENFNQRKHEKYGEVNSYARFFFLEAEADRKGVIIRNPLDIMVSAFNRQGMKDELIWKINTSLIIMDKAINKGAVIIRFKKFGDLSYCQSVIEQFGIDDLKVKKNMLDKVNATNTPKYNRHNLPPTVEDCAHDKFAWFMDKYDCWSDYD
jgi:hypothetical protein